MYLVSTRMTGPLRNIPYRSSMPRRIVPAALVGIIFGMYVVEPILDRSPPFVRSGGAIEPVNPTRGKEVEISYNVVIYRRCPGKIVRHVIDGAGMDHDYVSHEAMIVHQEKDDPTFKIKFILPGSTDAALKKPWTYYVDAEYRCNWTQSIWPIHERTPPITFLPAN